MNDQYLVVEALVKLAAIERLLVKSGVITVDNLQAEIKAVSEDIVKHITEATKLADNAKKD